MEQIDKTSENTFGAREWALFAFIIFFLYNGHKFLTILGSDNHLIFTLYKMIVILGFIIFFFIRKK